MTIARRQKTEICVFARPNQLKFGFWQDRSRQTLALTSEMVRPKLSPNQSWVSLDHSIGDPKSLWSV